MCIHHKKYKDLKDNWCYFENFNWMCQIYQS